MTVIDYCGRKDRPGTRGLYRSLCDCGRELVCRRCLIPTKHMGICPLKDIGKVVGGREVIGWARELKSYIVECLGCGRKSVVPHRRLHQITITKACRGCQERPGWAGPCIATVFGRSYTLSDCAFVLDTSRLAVRKMRDNGVLVAKIKEALAKTNSQNQGSKC